MKLLLDIQDDKASFVVELLKNLKFVKAEPLTAADSLFLKELRDAVEEVNLYKTGKLKGRPAEELLNEL